MFAYEVSMEHSIVTRLYGVESGDATVRVAAEIYPVSMPEGSPPTWRFYDFPTHRQAEHFADQALLALEYLGCTVTEKYSGKAAVTATSEATEAA